MIRLKLFSHPGCSVLIRAASISAISEEGQRMGVMVYADGSRHHVAHTIDQVMNAISKIRPIDTDDSVFDRVFGSAR